MKELLSFLCLPFLCGICHGESMKFVTVLSSPVGSFNKLEAVDSQTPAKGITVNFCTQLGSSGTVELKGTNNAKLKQVNIGDGATLGRTDGGKYSLNGIAVLSGGSVTGGRLLGETLTVSHAAAGKAANVYGTELTASGARADKLTIGTGSNVKSKIEKNEGTTDPGMVWSNEYQTDSACKDKAVPCSRQYLLKSGKGAVSGGGDCSDSAYKASHKSECCPGTPTTDTICWTNSWGWSDRKIFEGTFTAKFEMFVSGSDCMQAASSGYASSTYVLPEGGSQCGENDSFTRMEQECNSTTGGISAVCYYKPSVDRFLSSSQRFGWVTCTSDGWKTCTCRTTKWEGRECGPKTAQKNGW